jgi:hypothetical protein
MRCEQCYYWSVLGCLVGEEHFPNGTPKSCARFEYEPGTWREDA